MKHCKTLVATALALLFFSCGKPDDTPVNDTTPGTPEPTPDNIYQFKVLDGQGDSVPLSLYEGQVLLVVNTATQCGYTPQYTDLERIYETYRDQGFTILDFPCNQFNGQAPGSYDQIHDFCTGTYNISFPQFAKINVNGANASPLYAAKSRVRVYRCGWKMPVSFRPGKMSRREAMAAASSDGWWA